MDYTRRIVDSMEVVKDFIIIMNGGIYNFPESCPLYVSERSFDKKTDTSRIATDSHRYKAKLIQQPRQILRYILLYSHIFRL